MKLVSFFLLNTLSFNVLAVEGLSDFEKGLRVLLELELNKFESCLDEGKTDCDDSEVDSFLALLGEGQPVKLVPPNFPRLALDTGKSAEVKVQVVIDRSGEVRKASAISCTTGFGPAKLQFQWKQEGVPCKAFRRAAEKAALKWEYSEVSFREREEYRRYAKGYFEWPETDSQSNEGQFVEIKKQHVRKIARLKVKEAWKELKNFCLAKEEESPVFTFELAMAQQGLGERSQTLMSLERFLERGKNQYFHYGALAASAVIDARYAQENDAAVVAAGSHYNLMHYFLNGKQLPKYTAGLSLMRLASSLTFVKPQQLGRSLKLLNDLKDNIELVKDSAQRADLEAQVDAQLDNLRVQISQIGAGAKAKT